MKSIVIQLSRQRKRFLARRVRKESGWSTVRNIFIVLALSEGRQRAEVALFFRVNRSTVWRVAKRFLAGGLRLLRDGRSMRNPPQATPEAARLLARLVRASPPQFGYARPTWTRALLAREVEKQTGIHLSVTTVGRLLAKIGARWNRARPVVRCPWSEERRRKRLREIGQMLSRLPPEEVALFEDEVEIHLNPKIGFDWMLRGQQKEVVTPGQNQKGYLAGAVEAGGQNLVWVRVERKNSALFIAFLGAVARAYSKARCIQLIVDNCCIHTSKATRTELDSLGGKIKLHFLPPYCPQENKMELQWLHLHRNVTCNHDCTELEELMARAENYLSARAGAAKATPQAAA